MYIYANFEIRTPTKKIVYTMWNNKYFREKIIILVWRVDVEDKELNVALINGSGSY